jgi:hypothetical protein
MRYQTSRGRYIRSSYVSAYEMGSQMIQTAYGSLKITIQICICEALLSQRVALMKFIPQRVPRLKMWLHLKRNSLVLLCTTLS